MHSNLFSASQATDAAAALLSNTNWLSNQPTTHKKELNRVNYQRAYWLLSLLVTQSSVDQSLFRSSFVTFTNVNAAPPAWLVVWLIFLYTKEMTIKMHLPPIHSCARLYNNTAAVTHNLMEVLSSTKRNSSTRSVPSLFSISRTGC